MIGELERRLIDRYQRDLPLLPAPFRAMADELGVTEAEVIDVLEALTAAGTLSRVGAIVEPNTVGCSTLAAMSVPIGELERIAAIVNAVSEVNHNYEREHELNLWFVVTAGDVQRLDASILHIEHVSGLEVVRLPLEEAYHLDTGFEIRWN